MKSRSWVTSRMGSLDGDGREGFSELDDPRPCCCSVTVTAAEKTRSRNGAYGPATVFGEEGRSASSLSSRRTLEAARTVPSFVEFGTTVLPLFSCAGFSGTETVH